MYKYIIHMCIVAYYWELPSTCILCYLEGNTVSSVESQKGPFTVQSICDISALLVLNRWYTYKCLLWVLGKDWTICIINMDLTTFIENCIIIARRNRVQSTCMFASEKKKTLQMPHSHVFQCSNNWTICIINQLKTI